MILLLSASEHHKLHYQASLVKLHEIQKINRQYKCFICNKEFSSTGARAKYCSPHCRYLSRVSYFKKWYEKNKPKS